MSESVVNELERVSGVFQPDQSGAIRAVKICFFVCLVGLGGIAMAIVLPDESVNRFLFPLFPILLIGYSFWIGVRRVKEIQLTAESVILLPIGRRFDREDIAEVSAYTNFAGRKALRLVLKEPVVILMVGAAFGIGRTLTILLE